VSVSEDVCGEDKIAEVVLYNEKCSTMRLDLPVLASGLETVI